MSVGGLMGVVGGNRGCDSVESLVGVAGLMGVAEVMGVWNK